MYGVNEGVESLLRGLTLLRVLVFLFVDLDETGRFVFGGLLGLWALLQSTGDEGDWEVDRLVGELNGDRGVFVGLLVSELLAEVQLDVLYRALPTVHYKGIYLDSAVLEPHDQQPATLRKLYTVYFWLLAIIRIQALSTLIIPEQHFPVTPAHWYYNWVLGVDCEV